jgi:adenylate cyclase
MAEGMSASAFGRLMNRFYRSATDVLVDSGAYVDKTAGDQVFGIYLPVFAGENHARSAIEAASEILRVTGHAQAGGPWLPVGAGIHTGTAYFGTVAEPDGRFSDMTALGDDVNVAARLSSSAAAGEVLASEKTWKASGLATEGTKGRRLRLKGKTKPVPARALQIGPPTRV